MDISKLQMDSITQLITKEDKQVIALKAGNSIRTVESVMQSQRHTELIKKLIFQRALENWETIGKYLNAIQVNNKELATIQEYNKHRTSALWEQSREYSRYIDVYLQLSHHQFSGVDELWQKIKAEYNDVIQLQYYCIDLLMRLTGISDIQAIKFYNSNY